MQQYDIPLHDIKNVEFAQALDWLSIGEAVIVVVALFFAFRYVKCKVKKRIVVSVDYHKDLLNAMTIKDVKHRAYEITRIGLYLADTNEFAKIHYDELCDSLKEYKYKKTVSEFNSDTIDIFWKFVSVIDGGKDKK